MHSVSLSKGLFLALITYMPNRTLFKCSWLPLLFFFQYYWFKREVPLVLNSVQDYTALERWPFYSSLQVIWSACKTCWALLSGLLSGREILAAEKKRCRLGNYFKRIFFQSFLLAADNLFIIRLEKSGPLKIPHFLHQSRGEVLLEKYALFCKCENFA